MKNVFGGLQRAHWEHLAGLGRKLAKTPPNNRHEGKTLRACFGHLSAGAKLLPVIENGVESDKKEQQ
jgi:hypothetical protein